MRNKQQPIGICDLCLTPIPHERWYTSKGAPRRYCPDTDCRNTANSRAGAPIRAEKQREHVRRGEWKNPAKLNPPSREEQSKRSRLGRLREVARGIWRNPALTPAAREKLSRPRKHSGALHRAMEKLRSGKMADLTDEERAAWRAYRAGQPSQKKRRKRPE